MEVDHRDPYLTAFITKYGLFEYVCLPFGLSSAPATFQRIVNLVLAGLLWRKALAYLDDVTILGKIFENALDNLREVLGCFAKYDLKLNLKNAFYLKNQSNFLVVLLTETEFRLNQLISKLLLNGLFPLRKKIWNHFWAS